MRTRGPTGFTLTEMLVVIVLTGILAALAGGLILRPFQAYEDVTRRARLVDTADTALSRLVRELRQALPNSVRICPGGGSIEFLLTESGGRYRAQPTAAGAGDVLDFTTADASFDVLGGLGAAPPAGSWAVVYNLTATGAQANAYVGDNRAAIDAGASSNDLIALTPAFQFPYPSPSQRVFVVSGPVTYYCDGAGLRRLDGYAIAVAQRCPPSGGALVAEGLAACGFSYDPGAATRHGLVTARVVVSEAGESVSLLRQAHVLNVP